MEAYLAPNPSVQVNKTASSCEICGGAHDTQYCMQNPKQAFVDYASSRTDESEDAQLSKFEADFKQQQSEMTNKIDTFLKAINDRMMGALPSDTVKNPKLNVNSTSSVSSARSYPMEDPQSSSNPFSSANAIKTLLEKTENVLGLTDGTKSYPIGIVRNLEVYVGKLKLLEDFYVIGMWELEDMIDKKIDSDKPPKEGDGAWHIRIEMIDPDEEFDRVFQLIPTTRKLSEKEKPSDIIDLEHFYDA
nr:MAK10-like protein [Tanacetum cinerariifolium]